MVIAETTGALVGRSLLDARQTPPGVAAGALANRSGGIGGYRGRERTRKGYRTGGGLGVDKVGDGGGVSTYGIPGWIPCGGGGLAGGGPVPKRGMQLLSNMT